MTTPSSSATTPSPRPSHLAASPATASASISSRSSSLTIKEERQRAIQRFFANAELSQLARGLRTRLSYASFKAMHNLAHNTLPDLEAQAQSQAASSKSSANRPVSNTATPGSSANAQASSRGLTRKGTMPPPPPVTASATQSLFSSLLQPPPSKRARTIHNPQDPPVPPPTKSTPATPPRKSPSKASRASNPSASASKSKARKGAKGKGRDAGPSSRLITPQSTLSSEGFIENEDDMKAAATLTSLLLARPSKSGSASSPRSSISGASDAGSSHSFSHYAQSSTRTTAPSSVTLSQEGSFHGPFPRSKTPPVEPRHARTQSLPQISSFSGNGNTTPKAQARHLGSRLSSSSTQYPSTDTEAADLMLFLATSPSPVRASTTKDKESKDMAAFRSLGGQPTLKGRVLFPSLGSGPEERTARPLRRDPTSSFSSVLSSSTELIDDPADADGSSHEHLIGIPLPSSPLNPRAIKRSRSDSTSHLNVPAPPTVIPPTPTDDCPAPLLPSPSSSNQVTRPRAISEFGLMERASSVPALSEVKPSPYAPPTPNSAPFNFNEFINVSPSPAVQGTPAKLTSLRANVGRKLFEEHQGMGGSAVNNREGLSGHTGPAGLGAGIDLLQSSQL
ncbi:hypothetical protein BC835DRAFT_830795 [Cytidiella melzeri]|nr:hypothetical protein BC835DRAFT_830795 [Cytidiella melzeri]